MTVIKTADEAKQDRAYLQSLTELLYQLADDDFIISFRGSEWLGLAPHIEEDVSFSSITQNTMGHAVLYYQLLEELGEGEADILAHDRSSEKRRNAVYLEKKNGEGDYIEEPYYDWALTVIRQYLYETFKKVKLEALLQSSYVPLADTAQKVLMEQTYHLAHWKTWVRQLQDSTDEAKSRLQFRIEEAWDEFLDVLELGPEAKEMEKHQLIVSEEELQQQWLADVKDTLTYIPDKPLQKTNGSGRNGEHTEDLTQALNTLNEVYEMDKNAVW
ncbi:ring-1,2-phenylacetyl-CoA epoxidase subunit PaaC [Alteribacillus persepolensis]|uniref:Ring-1,2-phenylacetyl-CoA epoxidase subunit PaaC n=1 Tax=Alteribacillus persepolensis TaxID=568899 RepID=A0A1G8GD66_9BACI|nr:1,2-phenylacetyl-CoA epoxidase subunit PaaC [Alteribacillus persepolensis]SDH92280.1 ring-1,2-phenylacetyl-CoA epoxidase subunit PaaC [Alteribacillus persepolensis]